MGLLASTALGIGFESEWVGFYAFLAGAGLSILNAKPQEVFIAATTACLSVILIKTFGHIAILPVIGYYGGNKL